MFKVNDKVKMRTNSYWWNKGDIGRVVEIDSRNVSYYIHFKRSNCLWWADETDIRPINSLMEVE